MAGADQLGQQIGQRLVRALHAGRHDAGRDQGGLEQAEMVAGKVEDLGEGCDFGARLQIDADQPQNGPVDDPKVALYRGAGLRLRLTRAMHAQIDGDVQRARAFGEVHAQKEDVAPAAVRQVHAHGGGFAQEGEKTAAEGAAQRPLYSQGVVVRVADAKHPLVAQQGAHTAPHLIGPTSGSRVGDRPRPTRWRGLGWGLPAPDAARTSRSHVRSGG